MPEKSSIEVEFEEGEDIQLEAEDSVHFVLQAQLNEIRHYQSMARGVLGFGLTVFAVSIAAISAFYLPFPTLSTQPAAYAEILDSIPVSIGVNTALFTVGISMLIAIVFLFLAMASFVISLSNVLEILFTKNAVIESISVNDLSENPNEIVRSNWATVEEVYDMYLISGLRLIFSILLAGNSLFLYHLAATQSIWNLFWLCCFFVIPSFTWKLLYRRFSTEENSGQGQIPLLVEPFTQSEGRWEKVKPRNYEEWIMSLIGLLSLFVVGSWALPLVINLL